MALNGLRGSKNFKYPQWFKTKQLITFKTYFMKYLIVAFTLLFINLLNAQSFPTSWEGKWTGIVDIWSSGKKINAFPMSLEITPKDTSWNYTLTYQPPDRPIDIRNYSLVILNDSLGHYAIDEHNNIILDAYTNANCFYAGFGVTESDLLMRICKKDNVLEYEITTVQSDPVRVSGDTVIESDTIPAINSYKVVNLMKAVLELKE